MNPFILVLIYITAKSELSKIRVSVICQSREAAAYISLCTDITFVQILIGDEDPVPRKLFVSGDQIFLHACRGNGNS